MWPFKKKDEYVLVATLDFPAHNKRSKETGTIYFHLFENCNGKRKFEFDHNISGCGKDIDSISTHPAYHKKIYPWYKGENFPDIPTYFEKIKSNRKRDIKELYKRIVKL